MSKKRLGVFAAAVVFAFTAVVSSTTGSAHADGPVIYPPQINCAGAGSSILFSWSPLANAQEQWLEVSANGKSYAPDTFTAAGPIGPGVGSFLWSGTWTKGTYFWRINTMTSDGSWVASSSGTFVPCTVVGSPYGHVSPFGYGGCPFYYNTGFNLYGSYGYNYYSNYYTGYYGHGFNWNDYYGYLSGHWYDHDDDDIDYDKYDQYGNYIHHGYGYGGSSCYVPFDAFNVSAYLSSVCHPSYTGACLYAYAADYDCTGYPGSGPYWTGPVTVVGPDVFGLDVNGDGIGCQLPYDGPVNAGSGVYTPAPPVGYYPY